MATHKVPTDVETEDKIIGFLSMKQFIFVIVGLGFGWLTFFFATKVNIFLAIPWIPFTVVPLVLGLYQRKDQPVEVFLGSALRFYFKPRKRKWDQEGYFEKVLITAPVVVQKHYTKDFSGQEAIGRLQNLSRMMDSRGWASKLDTDWQNEQMAEAAASESRIQTQSSTGNLSAYLQPVDVMDTNTSIIAKDFQNKIDSTDSSARVHAINTLDAARNSTPTPPDQAQPPTSEPPTENTTPQTKTTEVNTDSAGDVDSVATPPNKAPQTSEPKVSTDDDGSVEISLH